MNLVAHPHPSGSNALATAWLILLGVLLGMLAMQWWTSRKRDRLKKEFDDE